MKIAFVKISGRLNAAPFRGDLSLVLKKMSELDIEYDIQAWDKADVDWSSYSTLILTSEIYYFFHVEQFIQWVHNVESFKREGSFRVWNSPQIVQWNVNKKYLFELESKGIKIPATVWIKQDTGTRHQARNIAEEIMNGFQQYGQVVKQVVIKNLMGADGREVWRSNVTQTADGQYALNSLDIEKIHQQMLSPNGKYGIMAQEFLPAILSEGEWSLIYFNKIFSHAVLKKPPSLRNSIPSADATEIYNEDKDIEFRVHLRCGGYYEEISKEDVPENLVQFGDRVLAQVSEKLLYARVDIVMSEDREPHLMELELLDPILYITKPEHADNYLQAVLSLSV